MSKSSSSQNQAKVTVISQVLSTGQVERMRLLALAIASAGAFYFYYTTFAVTKCCFNSTLTTE